MPAQADPDLLEQLAKTTRDIYGNATESMLEQVAKLSAAGPVDPDAWAVQKLSETSRLRDRVTVVVDQLDQLAPDAIEQAIRDAYTVGLAGGPGVTGGFTRTHTRAVDALAAQTVGAVRQANTQILRSIDDQYRRIIAEVAAPGVVTGTRTRLQATQQALDRFAANGITGFRDSRGRNWSIDSYAEMSTRTATGRAQVQGTLDRFTDQGRDLVIVSDHAGECHLCRPWEGRVLSISGRDRLYPSVADAQTGGLLHPNCRHSLAAYIEGLTQPAGKTEDPTGDRLRQEQRYLERGVRRWKRHQAVAITPEAKRLAAAKVRQWQGRLRGHLDDPAWSRTPAAAKRLRYREQIRTAGTSLPATPPVTRVPPVSKVNLPDPSTMLRPDQAATVRDAADVLEIIGQLHTLPTSAAAVDFNAAVNLRVTSGALGQFKYLQNPRTGQILGRAIDIDVTGDRRRFTIAHEFGHYLDLEAIGPAGTEASGKAAITAKWRDAVENSPPVKNLRQLATSGKVTDRERNFLEGYLLSPEELWARSYSQWVAVRSGDPDLLAAVTAQVAQGTQWTEREFGPIGRVIDELMEESGLL